MGIVNNVLAGASGSQGYFLDRSVRFRASASAYLSRTFGTPTNNRIWTWSAWVKRGAFPASTTGLFGAGTAGTNYCYFGFQSGNTLNFQNNASSGNQINATTTAVFRDPSAWYHVVLTVDTTQATNSNGVRIWINGVQQTLTFSAYTQNTNTLINASSGVHVQGDYINNGTLYFDGYLTEVNFIDGQALTPSSFGETSASTGVWIPKKYTGTYGTNGFYLDFKDNSALTTSSNAGLGKDNSGNGNYWTTNNISITSGATYDSMTDVPTLTSATAANYCVLNPLTNYASLTINNGNLNVSVGNGSTYKSVLSTLVLPSTGKYYFEFTGVTVEAGAGFGYQAVGISDISDAISSTYVGNTANSYGYSNLGYKANNAVLTSGYGSTWTTGDIIGCAVDMDAGTIVFYKNNTSQGTAYSGLSSSRLYTPAITVLGTTSNMALNCGQRPFAYTPPSGFVALNTFNLPTPTIGATASSQANKYFDATTYTGNGTSLAVTNSGSMQPDFLWIKQRGGATSHVLQDSVRGAGKSLFSNATAAESGNSGDLVTSFNSNGFTVNDTYLGGSGGGGTNGNSGSYIAWQWRASNATGVTNTAGTITSTVSANTTAGFSIVTYTGTGANGTVGHGLGVAPKMIICKSRTNAYEWIVWHTGLTSAAYYVNLNTTNAQATASTLFQSTAPGSSVITLGTNATVNASGANQLIYCFSEVAGYSQFGSYTGNGSTDGPFVFCGFRPRYVMLKNSSAAATNWEVYDTSRNPSNSADKLLYPNLANAEDTWPATTGIDILSNGFKIRRGDTELNGNGNTLIFAAFAENPFKYSLAR